MKTVGILNFQYSTHNYGAVLQAAALEHICHQLGHQARHIDYMAKPKITLKGRIEQLLFKIGLIKTPKACQVANQEAFERFRHNFINRTKCIKSANEFTEIAKSFDAVIVGSDQVWRPAFAKDAIAFFLGYIPKGVDRISYAASFGTETWEQVNDSTLTARVRYELRQFKAISCREVSGCAICKDVFGVEAVHVLDPLLLIDDAFFEKIIEKSSVKLGTKLVYYKLDSTPEFQQDLKSIGANLESNAVNIYLKNSVVLKYREVQDWLALILNAEVVVTDSFHCICLALRFGKEVIYCPNVDRGQTRLDSLFKQLDIEATPLPLNLRTPMFRLYRRNNINRILEGERSRSLKFIVAALDV